LFNGASGTLMATNSSFAANTANSGGGVYTASGATTTLRHVTVANNNGGGVGNDGTLNLQRSLVVNNGGGNCVGAIASQVGSLAWGDASCAGVPTGDPRLGALQDNGGPTPTMLPGAGSAALDAVACDANVPADERGIARPQGGACDVGAAESRQFALVVNVSGPGSVASATSAVAPSSGIVLCTQSGGTCQAAFVEQADVLLNAVVPNGYHMTWSGDCTGTASSVHVAMSAARACSATFETDVHTLTYAAGAGGSIVGTTPQTVNGGANGEPVTAVPDEGFRVQWSDGSTANPRTDTNVTADISVTAQFTDTIFSNGFEP
jgi:hypothetical protein